jgi:hypothetical protein
MIHSQLKSSLPSGDYLSSTLSRFRDSGAETSDSIPNGDMISLPDFTIDIPSSMSVSDSNSDIPSTMSVPIL